MNVLAFLTLAIGAISPGGFILILGLLAALGFGGWYYEHHKAQLNASVAGVVAAAKADAHALEVRLVVLEQKVFHSNSPAPAAPAPSPAPASTPSA